MRNAILPFLLFFVLITNAALVTSANADEGPYRASVLGGVTMPEDYSGYGVTLDFNAGYNLSGIVEARVANNTYVQIEGTYAAQGLDNVSFQGKGIPISKFGADVDLSSVGGFFNGIYEPEVFKNFYIFGGAGIGGLHVCADYSIGKHISGTECSGDFVYQVIGGTRYALGEQSSVQARFVYRSAPGVEIGGFDDGYQAKLIQVGYTHTF